MGLFEIDPRDRGYAALFTAIVWYKEISSETALRIIDDTTHVKRAGKITPEILKETKRIIANPNSTNINSLVKKFRINKYDVLSELAKEMFDDTNYTADEGVITIFKVDDILKKLYKDLNDLRDCSDICSGSNCEKCYMDSGVGNSMTLCELIRDMQFDDKGRPKKVSSLTMPPIDYNGILQGKTKIGPYRVYESVVAEVGTYLDKNKREKSQDFISKALLEYVRKKKRIEQSMSSD